MNTIKGNCTQCGKPLEIPAELEEFSCLYCGARLRADALRIPELTPHAAEAYEKNLAYVRENMLQLVSAYPDYYKRFSKKDYPPAFELYETGNKETLVRMEACAQLHSDGREAFAVQIAQEFLDQVTAYMEADPRWGTKRRQEQVCFETKFILALFMTPLLRKMRLSVSEPLRREVHRCWMQRYPEHVWQPGDYDEIMSGFRSGKFCFITSATCSYEGKPDDCAELETFRAFRDGWLHRQPEGDALIREYYEIAPAIVNCIEYCDTPEVRYAQIRERWLAPCYQALGDGRPELCRTFYTDMVHTLKKFYRQ